MPSTALGMAKRVPSMVVSMLNYLERLHVRFMCKVYESLQNHLGSHVERTGPGTRASRFRSSSSDAFIDGEAQHQKEHKEKQSEKKENLRDRSCPCGAAAESKNAGDQRDQ